jgi:hypothetical protein
MDQSYSGAHRGFRCGKRAKQEIVADHHICRVLSQFIRYILRPQRRSENATRLKLMHEKAFRSPATDKSTRQRSTFERIIFMLEWNLCRSGRFNRLNKCITHRAGWLIGLKSRTGHNTDAMTFCNKVTSDRENWWDIAAPLKHCKKKFTAAIRSAVRRSVPG